jgi:hypothetical protein
MSTKEAHQRAAVGVGIARMHMRHMLGRPVIEAGRKVSVCRCEERPREMVSMLHAHRPVNTGFSFATKAW